MAAFSTTLNVSIRAHGGGSWKGCEPQLAMHVYLEAPGSPVRFGSALVRRLGPMRNGTKPNTLNDSLEAVTWKRQQSRR